MRAKSYARITLLFTAIICIFTIDAAAQATDQNVNVTVRPGQTAEERAADQLKVQELKKAAEDKHTAELAAQIN